MIVRAFRLLPLALVAVLGAGCSSDSCAAPCAGGITFDVAPLAGTLARGSSEQVKICFDDACKEMTVTRDDAGGTKFLAFSGVDKAGDHHLTLAGTSIKGDYRGPLASYAPAVAAGCATCGLATVRIGADGTLTPGVPVTPNSSTAPTTSAG